MFSKFMEEYCEHLTDIKGLSNLIAEAKFNYRVQKLLVPYIAKDKQTFQEMYHLAAKDAFAKKLLTHCAQVLHDVMLGKAHDRNDMKELALHLNNVTHFLDQPRPEGPMEPWELAGYTDVLNRYLLEIKTKEIEQDPEMSDQLSKSIKELDINTEI